MNEYVISLIVVIVTMLSGSFFTGKNSKSEWYKCIKPRQYTPPSFVFPIVWNVLYLLLFLAFARSIRLKYTLINVLFILLFILNILWCYFYFYKKQVANALPIIAIMILTNVVMIFMAIKKKDNHLALMLAPHLAWIAFASFLNALSVPKIKLCSQFFN